MKRTGTKLISTLLLFLLGWTLCVNVSFASYWPQPGPDLPRIYIRNDGNVRPETSIITKTGNIYKLTGNVINYSVEVQCDNIVFDGSEYAIFGNASRIKGYDDGNNGIIIDGQKNVTIINTNFEQGETGIRILGSSNISVINNSFSNGIRTGILLYDSTQALIENNSFTKLDTDLGVPAVMLNGSKNTFQNNIISGSSYGITIIGSSNIISKNTIESILPMELDCATSNIISQNKITGPSSWSGRESYKGNEGVALFRECSNNLFFGNNITGFLNHAIRTVFSCSNNTFYGNYISDTPVAVSLQNSAVNNTFYANTFTSESCKFRIGDEVTGTSWDNGTMGNYWGDYNGTDNDQNGIGDSPYLITAVKWDNDVGGDVSFVGGQDNYPIINPIDINPIPEFPSLFVLPMLVGGILLFLVFQKKSFFKEI